MVVTVVPTDEHTNHYDRARDPSKRSERLQTNIKPMFSVTPATSPTKLLCPVISPTAYLDIVDLVLEERFIVYERHVVVV